MSEYTQDNRFIRVDTPLGKDKLLVGSFRGEEAVSRPFRFELSLLAHEEAVAVDKILGKGVTVTLTQKEGEERKFHGIVREFIQLGRSEEFWHYRAVIVPQLAFLDKQFDCRIFQEMTALQIIEQVLKDGMGHDYKLACRASYPKRTYCVQYRESQLDFVSRLMEEEGIYYFFEHKDGAHTMVLEDHAAPHPISPVQVPLVEALDLGLGSIVGVEVRHGRPPAKVTLSDYNPLNSEMDMKRMEKTKAKEAWKEEIFDYPGGYAEKKDAQHYAVVRIEREEVADTVLRGSHNSVLLTPGYTFKLTQHYDASVNASYRVLSLTQDASQTGFQSGDEGTIHYHSEWTGIPEKTPFRPPLTTPRPRIVGSQTARVVGKKGEEIFVDEHGRVKVQFHWDREGKTDDKSSCWVRVSSAWAGSAWGAVHIPRIGQEVVVTFLEGNPDRPLITGSVYNDKHKPPYKLPADQTQSGIKSRTEKGKDKEFNEIRFEDKKGKEELFIHAHRDLNVEVEEADQTVTIKKGDRKVNLEKGSETVTIKEGDQTVAIDKGGQTVTIKMGDQKIDVKKGKVAVSAMTSIELKVGSNSIKIDQQGVTVKGMKIGIEAKTQTTIEGKAMAELKAPMTTVKGDAMVIVQGGIAKIN